MEKNRQLEILSVWSCGASQSAPSKRRSHSAVTYDNNMYIFGGYSPGGSVLNDLYRFEFATESWKVVDPPKKGLTPSIRSNHTAAVIGNNMYVFGGWNTQYRIAEFHRYCFESGEWSPIECTQGPGPRSNHTCVVYGNSLFLFGGYLSGNCYNDLYEFDDAKLKWRKVKSEGQVPSERHSHTAVVSGKHMYIFGGCGASDERLNDLYKFNFETKVWTKVNPNSQIPKARSSHTAVVYRNLMLVFGGRYGDEVLVDIWAFDIDAEIWFLMELSGTLPAPRSSHSAVVHKDTLYIFGGCPSWSTSSCLNDLYKLGLSSPGSLQEDFQKLLSSRNLADVSFVVGSETIQCHKCIIAIRCPKLAPLLENGDSIVITDISAEDFKGLLQFMYTDKIQTKHASFRDMLSLYRAATTYSMERCKALCENELRYRINDENLLECLKLVEDNSNYHNLKLFTMDYFMANEAQIIQKNIQDLGSQLLAELFRFRLERPKIPAVLIPASTLTEDLAKLLSSGTYADCKCIVKGEEIPTHKAILASRSPYFEAAFRNGFKETVSGIFEIHEFPSKAGFLSLLNFIYTGTIPKIEPVDAFYLISAISYYGLEEKNLLVELDEGNALHIYSAAASYGRPDLKEKALSIIIDKFDTISQQPHIKEMGSHLLAEIIMSVGRQYRNRATSVNTQEKW